MSSTQKICKHWCFTYNNPPISGDTLVALLAPLCSAWTFQLEEGEKGTPHFQGYLCLKKKDRVTGLVKKLFQAHWSPTNDVAASVAYCKKPETRKGGPWEVLAPPKKGGSGTRTDLKDMALAVKAGKSNAEIFDDYPAQVLRYNRHLNELRSIWRPEREVELKVLLFTGPPGTGKTRMAYALFPTLYALPVGKDLWFNNYTQQKTVLIDDFAGNVSLTCLLQILDRYPVQVPTKGGFVWWCPETIIITSNVPLEQWYDYSTRKDSLAALKRRITETTSFDDFRRNFVMECEKIEAANLSNAGVI